MISRLQEIDSVATNQIDEPVFLREAPRPDPLGEVFQRLGLSNPFKRAAHDRFDQIEDPQCHPPIHVDPEPQVVEKFRMKNGITRFF